MQKSAQAKFGAVSAPLSRVFPHYGTDRVDFEARSRNALLLRLNAILFWVDARGGAGLECAWMLWITHIVNGAAHCTARQ